MRTAWRNVVPGSVVLGHDGYEWSVTESRPARRGEAPAGSHVVSMEREGRGPVTGFPPAGAQIEVISAPPPPERDPETERAIAVLGEQLGAELVECGWCKGDPLSACYCEVHCGAERCVNFR